MDKLCKLIVHISRRTRHLALGFTNTGSSSRVGNGLSNSVGLTRHLALAFTNKGTSSRVGNGLGNIVGLTRHLALAFTNTGTSSRVGNSLSNSVGLGAAHNGVGRQCYSLVRISIRTQQLALAFTNTGASSRVRNGLSNIVGLGAAHYGVGPKSYSLVRISRFCVGKDLPASAHLSGSSKCFTLKFFQATTAARCVAITNSFPNYLLGIGILRTQARDTVVYGQVFRLGWAPSTIWNAPSFWRWSLIY